MDYICLSMLDYIFILHILNSTNFIITVHDEPIWNSFYALGAAVFIVAAPICSTTGFVVFAVESWDDSVVYSVGVQYQAADSEHLPLCSQMYLVKHVVAAAAVE